MARATSSTTPLGRVSLLAALLAIAAVAATWFLPTNRPVAAVETLSEPSPAAHAHQPPAPMDDIEAARPNGPGRVAVEGEAVDDASPAPPRARPHGTLLGLSGVLSQTGVGSMFDLDSIKGLAAVVSIGGDKQYLPIPVRRGRFRLDYWPQEDGTYALKNGSQVISTDALAHTDSATIELFAPTLKNTVGDLRFLDPSDALSPPKRRLRVAFGEHDLVLSLQPAPAARLWVTDASTGEKLQNVSVHFPAFAPDLPDLPERWRDFDTLPAASGLGPGAPIPLPEDRGAPSGIELEVRVRGYAHASVNVDPRASLDVHVALHPCGKLQVELVGGPLAEATLGWCRAEGQRGRLDWAEVKPVNRMAAVTFRSVPPGPILIGLEGISKENASDGKRSLHDLQEVMVVSGQTARATLTATTVPKPHVPAAGHVLLPDGWDEIASIELRLSPMEGQSSGVIKCTALPSGGASLAMEDVPQGQRVFAFDAGRVPMGRYGVQAVHPSIDLPLLVPPGGSTDLTLQVDEPRTYRVKVVDRDTLELAPHRTLRVHGMARFAPSSAASVGPFRTVERPIGADEFTFQASNGRWLFTSPTEFGYAPLQFVTWYEGPASIEIPVPKSTEEPTPPALFEGPVGPK